MTIATFPPEPRPPAGWSRYFGLSTDAKVIGIQYIVTAFFFFLIGGLLAMVIRGELITPASDLVDRSVYNGIYTMHGTIMLFLFIFPVLNGLNNLLIPTMIGAPDMAFPRLNTAAFWLVPVFGTLLIASFFVPGGPATAGWWSYPPVSIQNPLGHLINGESLWILAVALSGISSIMGAVNFVTTILRMRAPGMGFFRMPVFCWTALAAQSLQLIGLPALTGGAVMLLMDLSFGTSFYRPEGGGDPVLYQHFFWFYSHPAVYVIILPVFGIFSEIFPVYSRKPLFGYAYVAIASFIIVGLGLIVWVHHMFPSGVAQWMRDLFMATTMLIAVPTGVKVFAWLGTLWGGKLRLTTPMLFCIGGLVNFVFAGVTGIMLATVPVDIHVSNTYFVVGHFHYVIYGAAVMGIFAAIYHWFPKFTGRMLNPNMETYKPLGSMEVPDIEVILYETHNKVTGIGEPVAVPTAAALGNAVYNASGVRLRRLPRSKRSTLMKKRLNLKRARCWPVSPASSRPTRRSSSTCLKTSRLPLRRTSRCCSSVKREPVRRTSRI